MRASSAGIIPSKLASPWCLAAFARPSDARERIWIVDEAALVAGSIAIVTMSEEAAQLRWFLLPPELRGRGLGEQLHAEAIGFCRESGYRSVFLWTVDVQTAAARLYRAAGFQLTLEEVRMVGSFASSGTTCGFGNQHRKMRPDG